MSSSGSKNDSQSSSSSGMNLPIENSSSLSSTQVANNSDILTQILLCLPVKSLLIFKSVSKNWFSLISDSYFAKNYTLRNSSFKIPGLFIEILRRPSGPPDDPEFEFPFVFLINNEHSNTVGGGVPLKTLDFVEVPPRNWEGPIIETSLRINHSCNGLLCCTRITAQTSKQPCLVTYHIYVYNPTTKQSKSFPPSPFRDIVTDRLWNGVRSVSLAFDPVKAPDHYQVICIWKDLGEIEPDLYNIEIYSTKTNSWRLSAASPFSTLPLSFSRPGVFWHSFFRSGVFWNGCLHWISTGENEASVYFDIEQDLVKPLPLPDVPNDDVWVFTYIGDCRNHLYLVGFLESCPRDYNIFEMETDYSGWNLIYKLDLERIINAYPEMVLHFNTVEYHMLVLFLGEAEEKSSKKLVLLINAAQVISYDLKEMAYKEIYHFDPKTRFTMSRGSGTRGYVHQYIESLACV
ncbi:F-box protein At5g07610-like [Papaver somniferum]|uniref:F-box protein At5g07610-like n=1 Tax=Papaver somniferum TaxID=3469 RepID=UPI000E6FC6D0|nr:F-box protein At5g07610-like [Papaver somniferum]